MIPIFNNFVDGRDKVWSSVICYFLGFLLSLSPMFLCWEEIPTLQMDISYLLIRMIIGIVFIFSYLYY